MVGQMDCVSGSDICLDANEFGRMSKRILPHGAILGVKIQAQQQRMARDISLTEHMRSRTDMKWRFAWMRWVRVSR